MGNLSSSSLSRKNERKKSCFDGGGGRKSRSMQISISKKRKKISWNFKFRSWRATKTWEIMCPRFWPLPPHSPALGSRKIVVWNVLKPLCHSRPVPSWVSQKKRKKHISAVPFLPNHVVAKKDILKLFSERRKDKGENRIIHFCVVASEVEKKNPEPVFLSAGNGGLCVCAYVEERGRCKQWRHWNWWCLKNKGGKKIVRVFELWKRREKTARFNLSRFGCRFPFFCVHCTIAETMKWKISIFFASSAVDSSFFFAWLSFHLVTPTNFH